VKFHHHPTFHVDGKSCRECRSKFFIKSVVKKFVAKFLTEILGFFPCRQNFLSGSNIEKWNGIHGSLVHSITLGVKLFYISKNWNEKWREYGEKNVKNGTKNGNSRFGTA
jgi:hypothetical protein